MGRRAVPKRPIGKFPRIFFRVGDQFLEVVDRQIRARCKHIGGTRHQDDRLQIFGRVVGQSLHQALINGETVRHPAHRMPVGRFGRGIDANHRARPGFVVNDDGGTQCFGELWRDDPYDRIQCARAPRKRHDHADRLTIGPVADGRSLSMRLRCGPEAGKQCPTKVQQGSVYRRHHWNSLGLGASPSLFAGNRGCGPRGQQSAVSSQRSRSTARLVSDRRASRKIDGGRVWAQARAMCASSTACARA